MTDATELDEAGIRARLEAATPGPWRVSHAGARVWADRDPAGFDAFHVAACHDAVGREVDSSRADAEFIAQARTDLPAALDEITRLRAALDEARADRDAEALRDLLASAESALEAVRALVGPANPRSATAGSAYSTGRWDAFAEVRAVLESEVEDGVFGDPEIHARLTSAALATPTTPEERCGGYLGGGDTCNKEPGHPERCWEEPATPTTSEETPERESWFREQYRRAKERNEQAGPHGMTVAGTGFDVPTPEETR